MCPPVPSRNPQLLLLWCRQCSRDGSASHRARVIVGALLRGQGRLAGVFCIGRASICRERFIINLLTTISMANTGKGTAVCGRRFVVLWVDATRLKVWNPEAAPVEED